jgi:hypothetical protein
VVNEYPTSEYPEYHLLAANTTLFKRIHIILKGNKGELEEVSSIDVPKDDNNALTEIKTAFTVYGLKELKADDPQLMEFIKEEVKI